jgi:hypothetical protein
MTRSTITVITPIVKASGFQDVADTFEDVDELFGLGVACVCGSFSVLA